jgi:hypothetical protein
MVDVAGEARAGKEAEAVKTPEEASQGGRQMPMVQENVPGWHADVIAAVRGGEAAGDNVLLSIGAQSRALTRVLGISESAALKYLRAVIKSGALLEVSHAGRRLLLEWPAEVTDPPDVWVAGEVKRGTFRVTEHREVGPAMSKIKFVVSPERLQKIKDDALARQAAKAAQQQKKEEERQARYAAEEAAERAVFSKHYPALAELLTRFHERVDVPDRVAAGVRFYAKEHPRAGVIGRVTVEVDFERFGVLEEILRNGLGTNGEQG